MTKASKETFFGNIMRQEFLRNYWLTDWEFVALTKTEQRIVKRDYSKYLSSPSEPISFPKYVDRDWSEININEWWKLFWDHEYKVIKQTNINWYLVSTIWLWLNHWFDSDHPLYFETMIFKEWSGDDLYVKRYTTKSEAKEWHNDVIAYMKKTDLLPNYTL